MLRGIAKETDKLIVMISHDLNIASKYADTIVVMAGGTIHSSGLPTDVVTEDMVREVYGVDCDVMDVRGRPVVVLGSPL